MIKYIQIDNFKSLRSIALPLERLNLMFGFNGMGKSSLFQSLLLLRQSFWRNGHTNVERLHINGELINLGVCKDIFCQSAEESYVRFVLCFEGGNRLDARYQCDSSFMSKDIIGSVKKNVNLNTPDVWRDPLFNSGFSYLGAEHLGPKQGYSTRHWESEGINPLGARGEYAVPYLAYNGNSFKVPEKMCIKTGKTNRLFDQVSAWMAEISPGIKLFAKLDPYEEMAKLDVSYRGKRLETEPFTPVNVGFGIPYVLPTIISLLISDENSIVLLENPESHLHPKGQTKIAELITRSAANGAQIFCESHSDHIINGIRLGVKDGVLDNGDVTVNYFDKNDNQETVVASIAIDKNGNLSDYPAGLLDEWGNLMAQLM